MTEDHYCQKLNELDRLLNDPDVALQPALIWRLLGEISGHESLTDIARSQCAVSAVNTQDVQ